MALPQNAYISVTISHELLNIYGIMLDDNTDYTFYFTTTYEPLFSSVRIIRGEIGAFITDIPDDTINLLIFENSMTINDIMDTEYTTLTAPYEYRQYVKCKTEYDLLHGKILKIIADQGARGGGETKRLGDFSISKQIGGTGGDTADAVEPALDKAKDCYEFWLRQIKGHDNYVLHAVKAKDSTVGIRPEDIREKRNWEILSATSTQAKGANKRTQRNQDRRRSRL